MSEAAKGKGGGVRLLLLPASLDRAAEQRIASDVERLGYACRHPAAMAGVCDSSELMHRHLVLICTTDADFAEIIPRVRALARVSPRRHLVLWPYGGVVPRERAEPRVERSLPSGGATIACRHRAEHWLRRSRPRAAEQWLLGAIAAAERRGDGHEAASIELDLCRLLVRSERHASATLRLRSVLSGDEGGWRVYAEAGALWADIALADGRVSEADAWLHTLETEAAIRHAMPAAVRERRGRVSFWIGDKLATPLDPEDTGTSEELGWHALSAWRDGQAEVAGRCRAVLRARGSDRDEHAVAWTRIFGALIDGVVPSQPPRSLPGTGSPHLQFLLRAAIGRAHLMSGDRRRSLAALDSTDGRHPEARLVQALRFRVEGNKKTMAPAVTSGLPGIQDFLTEKQTMVSVDGLERLLNLMEASPDEFGAAAAGCAWVRKPAPQVSVGIVSIDGLRLVAACGWKPADLSGAVAALLKTPRPPSMTDGFAIPVRHSSTAIAYVVVGPGERSPQLLETSQAFAMLAGPTVRTCLDTLDIRALERDGLHEILGHSHPIALARTAVARAATTMFPVLIEGQSGTGKELAARAIHRLSARRDRRFLAVNCAALTDELVEAELFGHARGAFTGAIGPRAGLFEEAHGGTLFLDEVAELSPRAQAKLLRVLQEREVRRVGENGSRPVDVRIVAATNMPLAEAAAQGRFRDDLRFRLAVVSIRLPPLQERPEDVPLLTHVFWRRALAETGKRAYLGPDAVARLARHAWPGNVRELQNVVAGLAVTAPTCGRVTARHVAQVLNHASGDPTPESVAVQPLDAARRVFERRHVADMLARHAGRKTPAAQALGLTRQGLAKTLRRLGLDDGPARGVA